MTESRKFRVTKYSFQLNEDQCIRFNERLCRAAATVSVPIGKLFTLYKDAGEEVSNDELSHIFDTLSERICTHGGI